MDKKVLSELEELKKLIQEQTLLKKEVLSFKEASVFVELSHSHLYYLISKNKVPAYKPNDGKLYLKREELVDWMVSKRRVSKREMKEAGRLLAMEMGIKKVPSTRDKSLDPGRN